MRMRACERACVRACIHASVRTCVPARVLARASLTQKQQRDGADGNILAGGPSLWQHRWSHKGGEEGRRSVRLRPVQSAELYDVRRIDSSLRLWPVSYFTVCSSLELHRPTRHTLISARVAGSEVPVGHPDTGHWLMIAGHCRSCAGRVDGRDVLKVLLHEKGLNVLAGLCCCLCLIVFVCLLDLLLFCFLFLFFSFSIYGVSLSWRLLFSPSFLFFLFSSPAMKLYYY